MYKYKQKDRKSLHQQPKQNSKCKLYEFCPQLARGNCRNQHSTRDKELANYIEDIISFQKTVILLHNSLKKPICIYDQDLNIKLLNQDENLETGKYYQAALVRIEETNILVSIQRKLGDFGNINCQLKIIDDFFLRYYTLEKAGNKKILNGRIKVNNQNKKVLKGEDRKYYLQKVNKPMQYPLMQASEVKYFAERGQPRVVSVKHQNLKVSGYIQIDSNGQFYLTCRNQKYDDMNPNTIPQEIASKLIDHKKIFPYSILQKSSLQLEDERKINAILKQYIVKGKFEDWSVNYKYPIASLLDQCEIKSFKSLKNAIIYELGIDILPFTKRQITESKKIVNKFNINNYIKQNKQSKQYIFTFDSVGTSCYDDALSFQKTPQYTNINIYIADVAEIVGEGCYVDEEARHRDSTVYVKNYYQPMFYEQLRNIFSLKRGQSKLALMLSFQINQKGFINFKSVKFAQKVIKICQNYRHQKFDAKDENLKIFFELGQQLQKSSIIKNSYFLQSQTKSEMVMSQIILISSLIPTFLFQLNQKRVIKYKQQFDDFIKTVVCDLKQKFKQWEQLTNGINKMKKIERQKASEASKIQNQIKQELKKCKKLFMKQLKQEKMLKKQKDKKQKVKKQKIEGLANLDKDQQNDSQLDEQTLDDNGSNFLANDIQGLAEISDNQNDTQVDKQEVQKLIEAKSKKRKQRLQEINNVESEIQSNESISSESDVESVRDRNRQKMNSALDGKRFMETIFDYFRITVDWTNTKKINRAFEELKKQQKGNLFQLYVKNVQITNMQHFPYIVQMQREKNPDKTTHLQKVRKIEQKNDIQSKRKIKPNQKSSKQYVQEEIINNPIRQYIKDQFKFQNIQIVSDKRQVINLSNQQDKKEKQTQQKAQTFGSQKDKTKKKYRLVQNPKVQNDQIKQAAVNRPIDEKFEAEQKIQGKNKKSLEKNQPKQSKKPKERHKRNRQRQKQKGDVMDKKKQNLSNKKIQKLKSKNDQIKQAQQTAVNRPIDEKFEAEQKIQGKNKKSLEKNQPKQSKKPKERHKRNRQRQKQKGDVMDKKKQNLSNKKIQKLKSKNVNQLTNNQQTSKQNGNNNVKNEETNHFQTDQSSIFIQKISLESQKQIKQIKQESKDRKRKNKKNQKSEAQVDIKTKQNTRLDGNDTKVDQPNYFIQKQTKMQDDEKQPNQQIKISLESQKQIKQIKQESKEKKRKNKKNQKSEAQVQVEQKLKLMKEQLNIKYQEKLKNIKEQKSNISDQIKKLRDQFKHQLDKIEKQFNILEFLNQLNQKEQKIEKKKKKKEKKKKDKKNHQEKKPSNMIKNIFQMLKDYAEDAQYSFKFLKYKELEAILSQKIKLEQISITEENLLLLESEASKLCKNQDDLLKWNNPIRCYTSLLAQRMIKQNQWLFEGQISSIDIIQKHKHLKQVKERIKQISQIKLKKIQKGETSKNAKEANRQIAKLQFYYLVKKNMNQIFTFLNVGSPNENKVKMVFHQILGTVDVHNFEFRQNRYKTVKGKVIIVQDFPLKLEVQLIE